MSRLCVDQDLGCGEHMLFQKHSTVVFIWKIEKNFFFLNERQNVKARFDVRGFTWDGKHVGPPVSSKQQHF